MFCRFSELQQEVTSQSNIETKFQCLLHNDNNINSVLSNNDKVTDLVVTDIQTPMLVVEMNSSGSSAGVSYEPWEQVVFGKYGRISIIIMKLKWKG